MTGSCHTSRKSSVKSNPRTHAKPKTPSVVSEIMSTQDQGFSFIELKSNSRLQSTRGNSRNSSVNRKIEKSNRTTGVMKTTNDKPSLLHKMAKPSKANAQRYTEVANVIEHSIPGPHRPKTSMLQTQKVKTMATKTLHQVPGQQ